MHSFAAIQFRGLQNWAKTTVYLHGHIHVGGDLFSQIFLSCKNCENESLAKYSIEHIIYEVFIDIDVIMQSSC